MVKKTDQKNILKDIYNLAYIYIYISIAIKSYSNKRVSHAKAL